MTMTTDACKALALAFARHLAAREYAEAYALTSVEYRGTTSERAMRDAFEQVVRPDWGAADPIEMAQALEQWAGRRDGDLLWVYVSIGGDVYSEGLVAIVALEEGQLRIRAVEFGRP